jgi:formate--tetrahydrofolate ligase
VVVAINHFVTDTDAEVQAVKDYVATLGAEAILCKHWAQGSAGIEDLAHKVVELADSGRGELRAALSRRDAIVRQDRNRGQVDLSRRRGDIADKSVREQLRQWEGQGYGKSADLHGQDAVFVLNRSEPARGAPSGHTVPVREVRLSAGAGFIVVITGEIMTMPGPSKGSIFGKDPSQRARARSRGFSDQVGAPAGIWSAVIRTGGSRGFA